MIRQRTCKKNSLAYEGTGSVPCLLISFVLYTSYTVWANHRILIAASELTPEQLLHTIGSSDSSIRDTLVHIMSREWIWLSRWKGNFPTAMYEANDFPLLGTIQTRWEGIEAEILEFIERLDPLELTEAVSYVNTRGEKWAYPLWQQLIHQVNHAAQHRSEVAAILTHFGCSPGDLDYLVYQDEYNRVQMDGLTP